MDPMTRATAAALLGLTLATAAILPAAAQTQDRAAALKALTDCRAITDGAARLACFDEAAARLDAAERAGEVVVLDREQVRTAKREAFGFSIPSLSLFDRDERQREEEVNQIDTEVASASRDGFGKWVVNTRNGQTWRQTDTRALPRVRTGDKVELRRGALGSFFMRVGGQPGVRAERVR
jgi:hypothetical protein